VSDVERLRDELALAEAAEPLEEAREAMHADRSPKNVKAYKAACAEVTVARQAFREKYPAAPQSGTDGVATPDTVKATGKAQAPR
jgi:hypothetical protein